MIRFTPEAYLTQIYNAYMQGRGPVPHLLIRVSPEFLALYESTLVAMLRHVEEIRQPQQWLNFRGARLAADPTLHGIDVRISTVEFDEIDKKELEEY